jgi:hypothetical protein
MGTKTMEACYFEAFPKCKARLTARSGVQRLEARDDIKKEIARLRKETEEEGTLSRLEKRRFLARVVRARLPDLAEEYENGDIEEDDKDLIHEVNHIYNKDGDLVRKVFKLPSKTTCIEIDNKMMGHNEPEEVNHNLPEGGVMLIPMAPGATLEDYEKAAIEHQRRLKGEALGD